QPDLLKKPTAALRTDWFKAVGDELANRQLAVKISPATTVTNGDQAVALYNRFLNDKAALATELALPQGTTLQRYLSDLTQALDDAVKSTSDVKGTTLDLTPTSDLSKLLGLDRLDAPYASPKTPFGASPADKVFHVGGVEVSHHDSQWDPLQGQVYI